jgi:hypothetical protein
MVLAVFEKLVTNLRFPAAWAATATLAVIAVSDPMALACVDDALSPDSVGGAIGF